jgi:hypothetical protein
MVLGQVERIETSGHPIVLAQWSSAPTDARDRDLSAFDQP